MQEWQTHIVTRYGMDDSEVIELLTDNYAAGVSLLLESYYSEHQQLVRPPFPSSSRITTIPRLNPVKHYRAIAAVDKFFLSKLCPFMDIKHLIWRSEKDEVHNGPIGVVPSLSELVLKKLSLTHYTYGSNYGCKYWAFTNEVFSEKNYKSAFDEFSVNNVRRGPDHEFLMKKVPRALNILYDQLGTRGSFKSIKFSYNPARIIAEMRLNTSSGIRPGPINTPCVVGAEHSKKTVNGPKLLQVATAVKTHMDWVKRTRAGEDLPIENYNVHRLKIERKCKYSATRETCAKIHDKKRVFYIPGLLHNVHGTWVNKERMLIERGPVINVGRPWWFGGALQFAELMCWDVPGIEWSTGDFVHHDKHIVDWLIMIWQANDVMYYDFASMTDEERFLFVRSRAEAMFNMVCKLTMHLSGLWAIISGALYSGGPETSPCGSWCTLFMWCIFLVDVMDKNPGLKTKIMKALKAKVIAIGVYGDDHMYCNPAVWSRILNGHQFAKFLNRYFGCILQEVKVYSKFVTEHDAFGFITYEGPSFLKRHFISGDVSKGELRILPFKPTGETIAKLFAPKGEELIDAALSALGQAWDTMFTNKFAYDLCGKFFFEIVSDMKTGPDELFEALSTYADVSAYDSFVKKLELGSLMNCFRKFPSYFEMRQTMHKFDPKILDFSVDLRSRHVQDFGEYQY